MQSRATSVEAYLAELPDDRRIAIEAVRKVILKNLDAGYREGIQYGMIGYFVPHEVFPAGYHCDPKQPLPFAALASQKNYMSLYLMGVYCGCAEGAGGETADARWFRDAWDKTGKKLDMGKACVRFRKLEDVALDVVAEAIRRIPAKAYVKRYLETLGELDRKKADARKANNATAVKGKRAAQSKGKAA